MFPDGYMKDKFPKPKNFLASYITPVSYPVPPPPANLPNAKQTVGEKKSSSENDLLPRDMNIAYVLP